MKLFNTLKITIAIAILTFSYWAKCQVPVANFTWSTPLPNKVVFQDLSTNNPTSWVWNFGDGVVGFVQNPVHVYSNPGTYQVCLIASTATDTSVEFCKDVTVGMANNLFVELPSDSLCSNSHIALQPFVAGGVPPYTYYWSATGNPLNCSTCENPQVTITQNSLYTLTIIDAVNASATVAASYWINASVSNIQLSANSSVIDCLHPVDTTNLSVSNASLPYKIGWGDGNSSLGSELTHTYSQPGDYIITLEDNNNCLNSVLNTIAFNGILINPTQVIPPNCEHQNTGVLEVTAAGGTAPYSFAWSNGANTNSIANIEAGNYTVTVTDASACSFSKHFNLAPANGWGYYVYIQPSVFSCNNMGHVISTVYGGTPPFSFNWNTSATSQNLTNIPGGVYNVTVLDSFGCEFNAHTTVLTYCYSVISGKAFSDNNNNCVQDLGEPDLAGIVIAATDTNRSYYGYADANGEYSIRIPAAGDFTIRAYSSYNSCGLISLCSNANGTITIASVGDTLANNNFGFNSSPEFDLSINPTWTTGNPGFLKTYWIHCKNGSPTGSPGPATVTFSYDPGLIYQSSNPIAQHNFTAHTLTWLLDSVPILDDWHIHLGSSFLVPQSLPLGHQLHGEFSIEPILGDCDSTNNRRMSSAIVTGAYDPNEKKVSPAGNILEEDSVLTYEIGFQNTGTDSTHFIIIRDTLSPYLDPATVRNIASSHPYSDFSISGTGILTWTFNPLRLVDSFTNEPGSHGFVRFTIKKKKNLPLTTVISNTAHIYFDYNTAVVTNTVTNTLTEPNGIWHIRATEGITVKTFPNPFSEGTSIVVEGVTGRYDFELYDVTGKLNKRITSIETTQFFINRDNLSSGIYFFKVLSADKKKSGYGKLVVE